VGDVISGFKPSWPRLSGPGAPTARGRCIAQVFTEN